MMSSRSHLASLDILLSPQPPIPPNPPSPIPALVLQCYAHSRDGGLPLSCLWRRLSPRKVPIFAVWLCALIGIIVVLPVLASNVVFFAVTGMSTVGWVGSYSVPIFFRIMNPEEAFTPGPFYMGRYIGTVGG